MRTKTYPRRLRESRRKFLEAMHRGLRTLRGKVESHALAESFCPRCSLRLDLLLATEEAAADELAALIARERAAA